MRHLFRYRALGVLIPLFSLLSFACSPQPVRVEGTAMLPTLKDGDRIILNKSFGELKRGDIISFLYPKDTSKWYVKRIIGLPGEKVEIRADKVFIDGQMLDEPYLDRNYNQAGGASPVKTVPENHFYVLGDNRDNSSDSRYWGTVSKDLIIGKYLYKY